MKPYEYFDHTADVGIRVSGSDLKGLFVHAAMGFYDLVTDYGEVRKTGEPERKEDRISLEASSVKELFFLWLRELLFLFSTKNIVYTEFDFMAMGETSLEAVLRGIAFNPQCHDQKCEVKAVTRHQFEVIKSKAGWQAQVIFDI